MASTTTRDMTQGSPARLIFGFFVPLLFGMLFQQIYSMVDTVIVGRFLGVDALAGVGCTGSVNFLVLGFCIGICTGFSIPVAQKFGEKDLAGLNRFVVNAFLLAGVLAAVMTTAVCLSCKSVLRLMNTPADIFDYAYDYIFVIFLGIPVVFAYNVMFGIIRSMGDSRTPVIYLIISSVMNVALDLLFIVVFGLGVGGAAWATVCSQAFSCLMCVRYIRRCDMLALHAGSWKWDGKCIRHLLGMGLPTGLQYSITAIGSIVLQSAVNGLGSLYVASIATGGKLGAFFSCPFESLGSTMATYGGQNAGAGKLDRIPRGLRVALVFGAIYSVAALMVLILFGDRLLTLFVDASETDVIGNAKQYLIINGMGYLLLMFVNTIRFLIQGLGFPKQAVFAGVCEMLARMLVGWWFVPAFGYLGACMSNPAAWLAADAFLIPAYFWAMRTLKTKMSSLAETQQRGPA